MDQVLLTQINNKHLKDHLFKTINVLIGVCAVGISQWSARPVLAQPPLSTAECAAIAINEVLHHQPGGPINDLPKGCGISSPALAAVDSAPPAASRTSAGAVPVPDSLNSAPLQKTEPDENPPTASPPFSAHSNPTNQGAPGGVYRGGGNSGRTSDSAPITQGPAATSTVNVKDWGASGSDNTYTCSIAAGSTTLTCTTPTDFQVGQYVAIPTAGPATPALPSAAPTVTVTGNPGGSTICYEIVLGDPLEGLTTPSAPTCVSNCPKPYVIFESYLARKPFAQASA